MVTELFFVAIATALNSNGLQFGVRILKKQEPTTTAFTVVTPWVNNRKWRKYLKHFRRKRTVKVAVEGLGRVAHLVMRYEAGDGMLGKCPRVSKAGWEQEIGWVAQE